MSSRADKNGWEVARRVSGRAGRSLPVPAALELALAPVLFALAVFAALVAGGFSLSAGMAAAAAFFCLVLVIALQADRPVGDLGWANRVTLFRGGLVCMLAGSLVDPALLVDRAATFSLLAMLVLTLDGLDGWLARRTGSESEFGARFDMELDALFTLVLCLALVAAGTAGPWIVLLGLLRYLFLAAGYIFPWMRADLPERFRRKALCVVLLAGLSVALWPGVVSPWAESIAAAMLAAGVYSFAADVRWLHRNRRLSDEPGFNTCSIDTRSHSHE